MKKLFIALLICLTPSLLWAQSQRNPCYNTGTSNCIGVGTGIISSGGVGPFSAAVVVQDFAL